MILLLVGIQQIGEETQATQGGGRGGGRFRGEGQIQKWQGQIATPQEEGRPGGVQEIDRNERP